MTREDMIDEAVRRLPSRSLAALKTRFIDGLTLEVTCIPFNIMPRRMGQIEDKAIQSVRREFRRLAVIIDITPEAV